MKEFLLKNISPLLFYKRRLSRVFDKGGGSRSIRVLGYHHISELSRSLFTEQLIFLKKYYNFLDPEEFLMILEGRACSEGISLLLTFDDGFSSNRWVAEYILKKMGIKAIFFVPSDFVSCEKRTDQELYIKEKIFKRKLSPGELKEMSPMSWDDLKWLLSEGHVIGAHTRNHVSLEMISDIKELEDEIINGGLILEEKLGINIDCFAYPLGKIDNINKNTMAIIQRHYKFCFSGIRGENGVHTSPFGILRDIIEPSTPHRYLQFMLEGGLDRVYRKKAISLTKMIT